MRLARRAFALALLFTAIGMTAKADLYDDYINSASRQPFVSFFARDDTLTGHAFVAVGTELDNGLTVYEGIYGYYPKSGSKKFMKLRVSEHGIVTFKENDYPSTIRLRKNVNDDGKKSALAVLDKWKSNDPKYNILAKDGKNCNSLAKEVAESIGLHVPPADPGLTFPAAYITRLRNINSP